MPLRLRRDRWWHREFIDSHRDRERCHHDRQATAEHQLLRSIGHFTFARFPGHPFAEQHWFSCGRAPACHRAAVSCKRLLNQSRYAAEGPARR
jgi:hypothetical protein